MLNAVEVSFGGDEGGGLRLVDGELLRVTSSSRHFNHNQLGTAHALNTFG